MTEKKKKNTTWTIEDTDRLYHISRWGDGYFSINKKGHLSILPEKSNGGPSIDIMDVIEEIKSQNITLPLHELRPNEDYYMGIFFTGAYQDVMGDMHNLFGNLNEVHIYCDDEDPIDFYIEEFIPGSSSEQVLSTMQYNPQAMASVIKKSLNNQVQNGSILPKEGVRLSDFYERCLKSYTYLKR